MDSATISSDSDLLLNTFLGPHTIRLSSQMNLFNNLIISPGQSTGISLLSLHPSSGSGSKMLTLDNYQQGTLFLQFLSQMTDSDCSWLSGVVIMMIMMMIMMMIIMIMMTDSDCSWWSGPRSGQTATPTSPSRPASTGAPSARFSLVRKIYKQKIL